MASLGANLMRKAKGHHKIDPKVDNHKWVR